MKCPQCSLITSDSKERCPRCDHDLRAKKEEPGLGSYFQKAAGQLLGSKKAPPPPTTVPKWASASPAVETAKLSAAPTSLPLDLPDMLPDTPDIADPPTAVVSELDLTDDDDKLEFQPSSNLFSGNLDEDTAYPPSAPRPSLGESEESLEELTQIVTSHIADAQEIVGLLAESAPEEINPIFSTPAKEDAVSPIVTSATPKVLEFSEDDEALLEQQINELLGGDEEINIESTHRTHQPPTVSADEIAAYEIEIEVDAKDEITTDNNANSLHLDRALSLVARARAENPELAEELTSLLSELLQQPYECFLASPVPSPAAGREIPEIVQQPDAAECPSPIEEIKKRVPELIAITCSADEIQSLWLKVEEEIKAHLATAFEIPASELFALSEPTIIEMLFDLAAEEISSGKTRIELSPPEVHSTQRKIPTGALEQALDRFEIAEAVQAVRAQELEDGDVLLDDQPAVDESEHRAGCLRRLCGTAIDILFSIFITATFLGSAVIPYEKLMISLTAGDYTFPLLGSYRFSAAIIFLLTWVLMNLIGLFLFSSSFGGVCLKIEVVNAFGNTLSGREIMRRIAAQILTFATGGIGLLPILTPSGRALHDRITHTYVRIKQPALEPKLYL